MAGDNSSDCYCGDILKLLDLSTHEKIELQKEHVWILYNYTQAFLHRQCNCVFKEYKNFEQLNSLVQLVLRLAINIISSWHQSRENDEEERRKGQEDKTEDPEKEVSETDPGASCKEDNTELPIAEDTVKDKCDDSVKDKEKSSDGTIEDGKTGDVKQKEEERKDGNEEGMEEEKGVNTTEDGDDVPRDGEKKASRCRTPEESNRRAEDEDWTQEEKERLLHLVAKVFHMTFPLYSAHKQYYHGVTDELSPQESEALGNYCDTNDLDVSLHLLRNVCFFCDSNGLVKMRQCFQQSTPETLPFSSAHAMFTVVTNLRMWLHLHAIMQFVVPLRTHIIRYLCKLPDKELRGNGARHMADMMWSAIKEPVESPLCFDQDSLELAFKFFTSATLTMRLTGLGQITNQIHMFNEVYHNESVTDVENMGSELTKWLLEREIVEHIFGPNMHVEIIKQCQVILNFLASDGALTLKHLDTVWAAAQLKHSGRYVHDLFPHLIKHLESRPLLHLMQLVSKLHPSEHTEQTLYLSQVITKCVWDNALSTRAMAATTSHPRRLLPSVQVSPTTQDFPLLKSSLEKGRLPLSMGGNRNNSRTLEFQGIRPDEEESPCHRCLHCDQHTDEEEHLDVVGLDPSHLEDHSSDVMCHHDLDDHRSVHSHSSKTSHADSWRSEGEMAICHAHHKTSRHPSSLCASDQDDSDSIDSENEAMATSPDQTDSGSDGSEGSYEDKGVPLGSDYEDVSNGSDMEMEGERAVLRRDGNRHVLKQLAKTLRHGKDHHHHMDTGSEQGGDSSDSSPGMEYKKVQGDLVLSPSDLNRSPVKLVHDLPVRGKLPTIDESPESEPHGLPHDPHQTVEYFHGPSSMDPEIYDCPRFLPRPRPIRRPMMNLIYPQHHHHDDEDDDEEGGGSCSSSQASAKSDKNMADFDGEDEEEDESSSVCEDALAQLSAQLSQFDQHPDHPHHRHHHHHHHHPHRLQAHVKGRQRPIANVSPVQRTRLSSSCSTLREDDDEDGQIIPFEDFRFEDVCKQSHTLLWDLVQDDSAVHLGDGLSSEAEKLLCSLVCVFPEREIRMRFVEGCLENLKQHRSVVVSLRLIPKLFASFQQYRNNYNTHWITMWAERELGMMNLFFADLLHYTGQVRLAKKQEKQLYTHKTEIQTRLQFLTCVFSTGGSPDHFRLTLDQVDTLWSCLALDSDCSDEALNWFLQQANNKDQHALGLENFKHIFFHKMPQLEPDSISMTGLNLFQQLCSLARLASSASYNSPSVEMPGIDHLWKIALRAKNTDVSLSAIQYINSYYINAGNGTLEKEEEFIERCMESLSQASADLDSSLDASLLVLQRGLILLKTHLEAFRKRYAYHLRQWQLEGCGIVSHQKHLLDSQAATIRILCQIASVPEKFTIEMNVTDLVADLRAEVTHFCSNVLQQQSSDNNGQMASLYATSVPDEKGGGSESQQQQSHPQGDDQGLSSIIPGPVRMLSAGHELIPDLDEKTLKEMSFSDARVVFVSFGAMRRERKREGADQPASCLPPPPREKLPMMLLLEEPHFSCLFHLLQQLNELKCDGKQEEESERDLESRAQMLSRNVWDLLMLLPTSPDVLNGFKTLPAIKLNPSKAKAEVSKTKASQSSQNKDDEEDMNGTPSGGDLAPVDWGKLLTENKPHKLLYSLQIIEALGQPSKKQRSKSVASLGSSEHSSSMADMAAMKVKKSKSDTHVYDMESDVDALTQRPWSTMFISCGGLKHLFGIFMSACLETRDDTQWNFWEQECLASVLKLINEFASEEALNEPSSDLDEVFDEPPSSSSSSSEEVPRKRARTAARQRKDSTDSGRLTVRFSAKMQELLAQPGVLERLMGVLYKAASPGDSTLVQAGYWVVHYAMKLLVSWASTDPEVKMAIGQYEKLDQWLRRLTLQTNEIYIRREVCDGLFRLCEGLDPSSQHFLWSLLRSLFTSLDTALNLQPKKGSDKSCDDSIPSCRDYFWLLCLLMDNLHWQGDSPHASGVGVGAGRIDPEKVNAELDSFTTLLSQKIESRPILEGRHSTVEDLALAGLIKLCTAAVKHNPPFKFSEGGQKFVETVFDCLFSLPTPGHQNLPKCKSRTSRLAGFDLLLELARECQANYTLLHKLMFQQHAPNTHPPYPWEYWPQDDSRSSCGYVGLTNLGATCYMASCMQQLFMMPEARAPILQAKVSEANKHASILSETQRMFAYLQESERKAYNPRSFCRVYTMDKQPLNTAEQKDMTEFFTDLISKMEEMTPRLKNTVSSLFKGELTNNVVSLDCPHVSQTTEEFFTVRCQVADMKNLYESLDEVTVKDTLEGDNMYTCSQCGKKVRAEKRACFKTLPKILSFNTMRYTFNMVTMMKEKVNTHFSFPRQLDMSGYTEEALISKGRGSDVASTSSSQPPQSYHYELIGVTVHTGTADGGHYYSFIQDRVHRDQEEDRWFMFNDAEVKPFDPKQLPAECYGGEMTTKTYDSVTDKYMDFSFEKTHSAYMLFYKQCDPEEEEPKEKVKPPETTVDLSKEIAEWIWEDNTRYLQDSYIFDLNYMNFMWQVCNFLPATLPNPQEVQLIASKLTTSFMLETLIHSKEKPNTKQWMELMTNQFHTCPLACEWFLDYMATDDWWPQQILIKCPIQTCRQLFQRLCIHVIRQLREKHAPLYLHAVIEGNHDEHDIQPDEIGNVSCVTRFIKKLLLVISVGVRPQCKHLTEYFSVLYDFAKIGEDEAQFLTSVEAISIMANFYLGTKAADYVEVISDDENDDEDDDDDVISLTEDKYKPTSLEKMISLIAYLVESSRTDRRLLLSHNDYAVLVGGKGFPFLFQQIRDNINLQQTRNLIFRLTRFQPKLAEQLISMIFNAISKLSPEAGIPFFKMLSLLVEPVPPGCSSFTPIILQRIWDISEYNPQQVLDWLAAQVPRNKLAHHWVLHHIDRWVEMFLIHQNNRVRNAAAFLLISLVPDPHFRQSFRSARSLHSPQREIRLAPESLMVLHQIYSLLLSLLPRAKHYVDVTAHGTSKLVAYFAVLNHCLISRAEKRMFSAHFMDLWNLYQPKLSEPPISCNHNKQALLQFWYNACVDYPDNVELIITNHTVMKHIPYNYILADHDDQEVVVFNRIMLPAYYGLLRLCCHQSPQFSRMLSTHQNMQWAFKYLTPHANQYPMVVEELFRMMKLFVTRRGDIDDEEEHITEFKKMTLLCYLECLERSSCWTTLISAFRLLIENDEDRSVVLSKQGLSRLADAFFTLHMMYHEATACHVACELVELLSTTNAVLRVAIQQQDLKEVKQSLLQFPERMDFAHKLLTLLNSYTPDNVRAECVGVLHSMVTLYPHDFVQRVVPLMHHAHRQFQQQSNISVVSSGPYFPRRMPKPLLNKATLRAPRPELQMFLHPSQLETSHGADLEYDKTLLDFFGPYHNLVETLCYAAMHNKMLTEEIIGLSVLVAYEGIPLQLDWFAKFWKTIYHTQGSERDSIQLLCSLQSFHDYVESVLLDERTFLNNVHVTSFFCIFFPRVYQHILCNNWDTVVKTICNNVLAEQEDIAGYDRHQLAIAAYKLNGDLRALLQMFSVVLPVQHNPALLPSVKHILEVCKRHQPTPTLKQTRPLVKKHRTSSSTSSSSSSSSSSSDEFEVEEPSPKCESPEAGMAKEMSCGEDEKSSKRKGSNDGKKEIRAEEEKEKKDAKQTQSTSDDSIPSKRRRLSQDLKHPPKDQKGDLQTLKPGVLKVPKKESDIKDSDNTESRKAPVVKDIKNSKKRTASESLDQKVEEDGEDDAKVPQSPDMPSASPQPPLLSPRSPTEAPGQCSSAASPTGQSAGPSTPPEVGEPRLVGPKSRKQDPVGTFIKSLEMLINFLKERNPSSPT
ncbi:ubiquitin carboxyl-terminal hydrolase 34-like isoform X2 [Lytechinus variegatus]|uniref:ubiquitin carboxyl-terminal hydrolase 34-like isoform X2 n=1 Tax=Lytechinus variegatus TaxID=7654 RepID=UPI001BB15BA6|nr:ubiquitin carboxyl-terminal hydrolase 34-like isoform X2 [Lytechinus variegatus]